MTKRKQFTFWLAFDAFVLLASLVLFIVGVINGFNGHYAEGAFQVVLSYVVEQGVKDRS